MINVLIGAAGVAATALILILVVRRKMASTGRQWMALIREHATFSTKCKGEYPEVKFRSADPSDASLRILQETYHLDLVAGEGFEIDRIINLMKWINRNSFHPSMIEFVDRHSAAPGVRFLGRSLLYPVLRADQYLFSKLSCR